MQILFRNAERVESPETFHLNHLGYGVFETFLLMYNQKLTPKILGLDLHLQRLKAGCDRLGLKFLGFDSYTNIIEGAIKELEPLAGSSYRMRIVVYEGDWFYQVETFQRELKSLTLKSVRAERYMPEVKSCSALPCITSQKIASSEGYDEGLLIDRNEMVRETSWGNFFWFDKGGTLYTAGDKVLKGVTRELILKMARNNHQTQEGDFYFNPDEITSAFTCRSTNGISKVSKIDDKSLDLNCKLTEMIQSSYENLYLI